MGNVPDRYDTRRPYSVNLKLNRYEYEMLKVKTERTHRNKSAFLRELICSSCPVEAPPPEFYRAVNSLNKIGVNINQIAADANSSGLVTEEDIEYLRSLALNIEKSLAEIRTIVRSAHPFSIEYVEMLAFGKESLREDSEDQDPFDTTKLF